MSGEWAYNGYGMKRIYIYMDISSEYNGYIYIYIVVYIVGTPIHGTPVSRAVCGTFSGSSWVD